MKFILDEYASLGYLETSHDPDRNLFLYNYSPKTTFEKHWTPVTRHCRGIVVDADGVVVSRGFSKFFNYQELPGLGIEIPAEGYTLFPKFDGSMVQIALNQYAEPIVTTRGSFKSPQALKAHDMIRQRLQDMGCWSYKVLFSKGFTYVCEVIFPENRIVVDYGDREDLVLLGVFHTSTGNELDITNVEWPECWSRASPVHRSDGPFDLADTVRRIPDGEEGFVVKMDSGLRFKVKSEDYVQKHRIFTGLSTKRLWEHFKDGGDLGKLLMDTPEEMRDWVLDYYYDFHYDMKDLRETAESIWEDVQSQFAEKREQACAIQRDYLISKQQQALVFNLMNGKSNEKLLWGMVKPSGNEVYSRGMRNDAAIPHA